MNQKQEVLGPGGVSPAESSSTSIDLYLYYRFIVYTGLSGGQNHWVPFRVRVMRVPYYIGDPFGDPSLENCPSDNDLGNQPGRSWQL